MDVTPTVTLVGCSDALGVPRIYCDCDVCGEARTTGLNRRTRSSALVSLKDTSFWIDCGPDWRTQMDREDMRTASTFLITHAHQDHIGGIPDLYDVRRWTSREVTVRAPAPVLEQIVERFPWVKKGLTLLPLKEKERFFDYELTTWEVSHGFNGRSFAFRFASPTFEWAYCPDSISLTEEEKLPLFDLDLLVLGTSFYREEAPLPGRSVYDMVEALDLLQEIKPKRTVFTHLSHNVDRRRDYLLPLDVAVAFDGMKVELYRNDR